MDECQTDNEKIQSWIRCQVEERNVRFTLHAQQEMTNDQVSSIELLAMFKNCIVLENYPDYKRGPCCLVGGNGKGGRHLHAVCTTSLPELIIITVYEPTPPKWETPFLRGKKQ
ncbi:MAG: DUF4258 domain-containing protein [Thermodesulfobacteriota bacterium]|nr:DUF4258 domain-containing protein [Thermodesulfobacteriota bacterium]